MLQAKERSPLDEKVPSAIRVQGLVGGDVTRRLSLIGHLLDHHCEEIPQ